MAALEGKVFAMLCRGTADDRAIAVALAEAGADIAIATLAQTQQQEFATASIANEIWSIGREQFSAIVDARDPASVGGFADAVVARLGRCDGLIVSPGAAPAGQLEQFEAEAWLGIVQDHVVSAALAVQVFAPRLPEGGTVDLVLADAGEGDAVAPALNTALIDLAAQSTVAWASAGVLVTAGPPAQVRARITTPAS